MKVVVDENSGFCFGVVYAIEMAEDELNHHGKLYCLGDIVHNDREVERLREKGLEIIRHEDLKTLPAGSKVLIRAHGEPPETYQTALKHNIELVDASCPVVLKLQNRVKTNFTKLQNNDGQVVIYGKPGHAEINGLLGQTARKAIIVRHEEDLDQIDFTRPIMLFSQTTKSMEGYYSIRDKIITRAREVGNEEVHAHDTICRQVSNREPQLREFSRQHDVIIFVSGRKSSNGKVLHKVCKSVNSRSYFVIDETEVQDKWFEDARSVGVCGATSTPMWLMQQVARYIENTYRPQPAS